MSKRLRIISVTSAGLLLVTALAIFGYLHCTDDRVRDFDPSIDTASILQNFKEDRYWLIAEELQFDEAAMLKTRSPNQDNSEFFGKLYIKVIRQCDKTAAFTTYYRKSDQIGWIQFVSVNKRYRGKGFGKKLTTYAMNDLINNMGCTEVKLVTRTNNLWAQRIYTGLGFQETGRDSRFVDYTFKKR